MKQYIRITDEYKFLLYLIVALASLVAATALPSRSQSDPLPKVAEPGYGLLSHAPLPEPRFKPLALAPADPTGSLAVPPAPLIDDGSAGTAAPPEAAAAPERARPQLNTSTPPGRSGSDVQNPGLFNLENPLPGLDAGVLL